MSGATRNSGQSNRQSESSTGGVISPVQFGLGLVLLAVAITMTVFLVISHFNLMALPGCGEGGGCAEVTRGKWGKVPGTGFPVSFVGLAYFTGLFIAWAMSRGGVSNPFKLLVRLGVLLSVMFIVIMVGGGHLCYYCLGTHGANIFFWLIVEFGGAPMVRSTKAVGAVAATFVVVCAALFVVDRNRSAELKAEMDRQTTADEDRIVALSKQGATPEQTATTMASTADSTAPRVVATQPAAGATQASTTESAFAVVPETQPAGDTAPGGFTGRYRLGPEAAPVRMLMITDYQCPDCRAVEMVAARIIEQHPEVSLSIKHFPFDASCNPHMSRTMHGNACWAARAAEAAGMLRGNEGFWQMHHWLFERRGAFTDVELNQALAGMGYDPQEFINVMTGPETLERVQADAREGSEVGVFFTPMIFVNGVHLRSIFEANADRLRQSVEKLLAENLPARTAAADRKPTGTEIVIGDWKAEAVRTLPPDSHAWTRGPDNARLKIVLFGDLLEPYTAEAHRAIYKWLADKPEASYSYRHFPFNQECNSVVSRTAFAESCTAARAVEASGMLGGVDAFWGMTDWLMNHQSQINAQTVMAQAGLMGLDAAAFSAKMSAPEVASSIEEDCRAAKRTKEGSDTLLYRGSIPTIFLNGRVVPRFRVDEKPVLDKILDEAYSGR